jgi:aryl-alcohol dehydrogenase-like predicted oxidoreductase
MELRRLGSDGPEISTIGLGTAEDGEDWGRHTHDADVVQAIQAALDAGMTWIDTAETYGANRSEELVGRAIAGRRDSVVLATKLAPEPWGTGFRSDQVRRGCEASLGRLGTDRIDLYQLHLPDPSGIPLEETWGAMVELIDSGLVRHIGVSNFTQAQIEQCHALHPVTSVQLHYSMVYNEQWALARWCAEERIGILAYGPLGYGVLTGAITADTEFDPRDWRSGVDPDEDLYLAVFEPRVFERNLDLLERLRAIGEQNGLSLVELVLAWTVAQPEVTSAIVGTRDERHARANARVGSIQLAPAALTALDEALAAHWTR